MDYLIDFILLALIYFLFFYRRWSRRTKRELILNSIMYLYIVMVLFVTLMPFITELDGRNNLFLQTVNLIPFRDLILNYHGALREIILNIIMMIPFGFLLPVIKRKSILTTVITTSFFSLIIECSQLFSVWRGSSNGRAFDVTDLITNTAGGLVGYIIFIVLRPVVRKILNDNTIK